MDKIYIRDLEFIGYHGVFEEEKKLGQKFFVSMIKWWYNKNNSLWRSFRKCKKNLFSKEIWFNRNFSRGYSKRSIT